MTRFFIITLLFCLTTLATAQISRHEIGVIMGPSSTNLIIKNSEIEYNSRIAALAGLKYRYIVTQHWSITLAPSFERKGIGDWTDYRNYDYLIFPLSTRYELGDFFVSGGGYYGYLLNQRVNSSLESRFGVFRDDNTDFYRRSDAGLSAGIGFRINLGMNWFLDTEIKYSHGLANIFKRTSNVSPTVYTRSTALIVGLNRRL